MELLSILDWKIDSSDVMKTIYESNDKQMAHVKTLAGQIEPGEFTRKDLIFFAYLQLIPGRVGPRKVTASLSQNRT